MDNRLCILLGTSTITYNSNFRMYITTKSLEPKLAPRTAKHLTIVKFAVTKHCLESYLMWYAMPSFYQIQQQHSKIQCSSRSEISTSVRPETENQRNELLCRINKCQLQLRQANDRILTLLFESDGNILDDEALVDGLNETKEEIMTISARVSEYEETESGMMAVRIKFRPLAERAAIIFTILSTLIKLNAVYHFNLEYFANILRTVIGDNERMDDSEQLVALLMERIVVASYTVVSTSLFEEDRLVYRFMLVFAVEQSLGRASDQDLQFLLRMCADDRSSKSVDDRLREFFEEVTEPISSLKSNDSKAEPTVDTAIDTLNDVNYLTINDRKLVIL